MTEFLIYMAEGPSGGRYIGLTGRSMARRLSEHRRSAKRSEKGPHCRALRKAMIKYGFEAFKWTVLIEGLTREEADQLERFLISTMRPEYNISPGGFSPAGGNHRRAVVCINTGKLYASGKEAARETGAHPMSISLICRNGGETKSGLRFRFADAEEVVRVPRSDEDIARGKATRIQKLKARRHPPATIEKMRAAAKARGVSDFTRQANKEKRRKHIVCVETGTVFRDASEAAMAYGVKVSHVYDRLHYGRASRQAGVTWRHANHNETFKFNVMEA